jgi:hypothetical protein
MEETYSYEYQSTIDPQVLTTILLIWGAIVAVSIASHWKVFAKAGRSGWAALIPIYNLYVLAKIVGKRGTYLLWFLVPIANLVAAIKLTHYLSKSFGKGTGFTLGLIFLPIVFYPILAFGDAKYIGPYADREAFAASQQEDQFEFETAR